MFNIGAKICCSQKNKNNQEKKIYLTLSYKDYLRDGCHVPQQQEPVCPHPLHLGQE